MVQDKISHEKYGMYAALFSLSYLFINLADAGVNSFITKQLSSDKTNAGYFFSHAFAFKIIACVLYPLIVTLIGWVIGYEGEALYFLAILGLVQALLQAIYFFRGIFQSYQLYKLDSAASVADKVLLLLIVVPFLYIGLDLSGFIHSVLISSLITFTVFLVFAMRVLNWKLPVFKPAPIVSILKLSFPFALIGILYAMNERIDMVMLERLGGESGTRYSGLYAAAYRWMDAFMMYLWTILPIFFSKFAMLGKEPQEQQKLFNLGQVFTFIPLAFVVVFVQFYGDKLFWMFKHSDVSEIAAMTSLLKILFLGVLFQAAFAIYSTYLTSTGHEKKVSWMIVASLLLNVTLNSIFIPSYGPLAAAYATLASTVLICGLLVWYISGHTALVVPWRLHGILLIIVLMVTIGWYFLTLTILPWYIISLLAGILLAGITYITNAGDIQSILKGK